MKRLLAPLFFLAALLAPLHAQLADVPGSRDFPLLKRYEGAKIFKYSQKAFDEYTLPLGKCEKFDFTSARPTYAKSEKLAGRVTRISYLAPAGRAGLEVFRNYQQDFKAAGFETLFEGAKDELGQSFDKRYEELGQIFAYSPESMRFLAVKLSRPEGEVHATLFLVEFGNGFTGDLKVEKGQVAVQLDIIEARPMDAKMVTVTSAEMARAIGATGKVALYGIFFDFNKADLKPQSAPALEEIAKLLKADAALKILVVGHTDNVGGYEANLDLSRRRAESVVRELTAHHGLAANRLTPAGVGFLAPAAPNTTEEGRAKNRRVELVPN